MSRSSLAMIALVGLGALVIWAFAADESDPAVAPAVTTEPVGTPGSPGTSPTSDATPPPVEPIPVEGREGTLVDLDGWLNTAATTYEEAKGEVTIVQFWTFGCRNCKATLPVLQELYSTYGPDGLEIIGVHTPEFEYERDRANIEQALTDLGVLWPVALDTRRTNFRSWQHSPRYWPRTYVVDQNGDIRFDRIGEGAYERLEATVSRLLSEGP